MSSGHNRLVIFPKLLHLPRQPLQSRAIKGLIVVSPSRFPKPPIGDSVMFGFRRRLENLPVRRQDNKRRQTQSRRHLLLETLEDRRLLAAVWVDDDYTAETLGWGIDPSRRSTRGSTGSLPVAR